jgi:hypothetical protein
MSAMVRVDPRGPHPPPQHATAEAYAAFLWTRPSLRSGAEFLKARRRFVRLYPNLEAWFAAPLAERVGWTTPPAGIGYGVVRARPYLTFLAYGGYARFDWPWILAINHHVVSSEWLRPEVDRYIQALAAEAVRLGYGRVSSQWHLRRTLKYGYLHDPDHVLHLEEADLATFEEALRADYQKVLGPGAVIAGPLAAQLRAGSMPQASIDWLKTNFFRTELELGHCLRLPQEGPCECDLYLSCVKFVTTRAYAPRLRARRRRELVLIDEAVTQGWPREVERHRGVVQRIEQLLMDLGEPVAEGEEDRCGSTSGDGTQRMPDSCLRA